MKLYRLIHRSPTHSSSQILANTIEFWSQYRHKKVPIRILLALILNLLVAPAVLAASGGDLSRSQSYWLGALGLVTIALGIYLFTVMFVPEKF